MWLFTVANPSKRMTKEQSDTSTPSSRALVQTRRFKLPSRNRCICWFLSVAVIDPTPDTAPETIPIALSSGFRFTRYASGTDTATLSTKTIPRNPPVPNSRNRLTSNANSTSTLLVMYGMSVSLPSCSRRSAVSNNRRRTAGSCCRAAAPLPSRISSIFSACACSWGMIPSRRAKLNPASPRDSNTKLRRPTSLRSSFTGTPSLSTDRTKFSTANCGRARSRSTLLYVTRWKACC
mmetsp:Transcript_13388/g.33525  ORF Transcript_13388/g.33525 Transcript_13388/m.33525 type:complete len:235 (+) Transcript_13388:669-1373(+)